MKILFFSRRYTVHDRRFLLKLSESCHQVAFLRLHETAFVYEPEPPPSNIRTFKTALGKTEATRPADCLPLMADFEKAVSSFQPDLIHAGPLPTCAFMTATLGFRPLVSMSWGYDILEDSKTDASCRDAASFALRNSDHFICDCREVLDKAKEISGIPSLSASFFPWGIDLSAFAPATKPSSMRARLGWSNDKVLLSTRSWEDIYGVDTVLNSFKSAAKRHPGLKLILLGDGSLAPEIKAFVKGNGLSDRVHMPGNVPNGRLADYFHAADIYVSASKSDGTSISLLEAFACGLPAIVSRLPGNMEWLREGVNGFFGVPDDPASFEAAIERALAMRPDALATMKTANLALARERADWDKNFLKLLDAYSLVEGRMIPETAGSLAP